MGNGRKWLSVAIIPVLLLAMSASNTLASEVSIAEKTKTASDYLAGKLLDIDTPVTYDGPPITIRYASFMSPAMKSWYDKWNLDLAALERESKGKLVIKPYYSAVLHGPTGGFEACSQGVSDYDHCYSIWKGKSFHLVHGISLPFIFPDAAVASIVAEELYPKYFKKEYEAQGVYVGRINALGTHHLLTKKKPIRRLEDLKGLKVACGGGVMAQIIKSLGAVPVITPPTGFYTGFQRGLFDAVLTMDAGVINFRVHEIGKYRTEVGLTTQIIESCINKEYFDGLPKDLQKVFYNWLRRGNQTDSQIYIERGCESAREIMRKKGIETIILPPEELARWKEATRPVRDKFIADNEALGLPAKEMLRDMEVLTKKYTSMSWNDIMRKVVEDPVQGLIDF